MSDNKIVVALADVLREKLTSQVLDTTRAAITTDDEVPPIEGTVGEGDDAISYRVVIDKNPDSGKGGGQFTPPGPGRYSFPYRVRITTPVANELGRLARSRAPEVAFVSQVLHAYAFMTVEGDTLTLVIP